MTPTQHSGPTQPDSDRPVLIYAADYPLRADVRRGEDLIGLLCADGHLDVLDGAVIDWASDAAAPTWHSLQNLPRLAALSAGAWAAAVHQSLSGQSAHPALRPLAARLTRGHGVIIAIGIARATDLIRDRLSQTGATVHINVISADLYSELRNIYRPAGRRGQRESDDGRA